jgi:hypothetical protein
MQGQGEVESGEMENVMVDSLAADFGATKRAKRMEVFGYRDFRRL